MKNCPSVRVLAPCGSMQCCSAAVSSVLPSPRAAHVASQDAVGSVAGSGPRRKVLQVRSYLPSSFAASLFSAASSVCAMLMCLHADVRSLDNRRAPAERDSGSASADRDSMGITQAVVSTHPRTTGSVH